jgi:hypothetical protein
MDLREEIIAEDAADRIIEQIVGVVDKGRPELATPDHACGNCA